MYAKIFGEKAIHDNAARLKTYDFDTNKDDIDVSLLKNKLITSNKGNIGHLTGAAGAVESVFSILSLTNNICPAIFNLQSPCNENISFV